MAVIVWFTRDLRLFDLPSLSAAQRDYDEVIPVYIHDTKTFPSGGAADWWLHHSLKSLSEAIANKSGFLNVLQGYTLDTLDQFLSKTKASAIYFSRGYEPKLKKAQKDIYGLCKKRGVECKQFGGRLLLEPDQVFNQQEKPFQVFTPFYKHCRTRAELGPITASPIRNTFSKKAFSSLSVDDLGLLPHSPNWAANFSSLWRPGEEQAKQTLYKQIPNLLNNYQNGRDFPARDDTSKLSPHLAFGEISPHRIHHYLTNKADIASETKEPYIRQLFWRDFSYYLLFHWPEITDKPFKQKFTSFPWVKNKKQLEKWQKGETGYPIVDAGMRQLWETGWMHNRVRMIVASFLTKHLRIHWKEGAAWFQDTLVDFDLANNTAGWQWVAGSGADAAPYFRIFNPITQSEKFDSDGEYIRRWVPELAKLKHKSIHKPWEAKTGSSSRSDSESHHNYPNPMVDHQTARAQALEAYNDIK